MSICTDWIIPDFLESLEFTDFISESIWLDEYIQEETVVVAKKNIFQKLWSMLKRFWSVVKTKAGEIFNAFLNVFKTKKVNDKTLDQIAEYVLGGGEDPGNKHLQFRYEDDKRVTISYITNTIRKFVGGEPAVPGHDKKDRPIQYGVLLVFHLIKKPHLLDPIIDMLQSMKDNGGKITYDISRAQKAINNLMAGTAFGFRCTISLEEWTRLNDKVIELNNLMQIVDDDTMGTVNVNPGGSLTKKWTEAINDFCQIALFLQYGVNCIGDGMRQIYQLDSKYHDRINSKNFRELLPKFVKTCVEYNIPSKYVHYAVRQITDVSLNSDIGNPSVKADVRKTLTGNGRFVLFPGAGELRNKVIKIGYNGLGVRGNRLEFVVWNKVQNIPEISDELYHIYDIGDKDHYVILTDRAKPIQSYPKADDWNKRMKDLCLSNNIGFIIRTNAGGFGEYNGKVISVDYGTVHRIDR